jgi:hypothetical protein
MELRASPSEQWRSPEELLTRALECRRRLRASPASTASADDLALQLDYDLALLRLCQARGIDCDPDGFGRPLAERRRLEDELARSGVDLKSFDSAPEGRGPNPDA